MAKQKLRHSWRRVFGPDLDPTNKPKAAKNKAVLQSEVFITACERAKIDPTKRQASKWNRKTGLAYQLNKCL